MIADVVIKKLTKFSDERGWLTEVYRHDEVDYLPAMGYISVTKPGVVRGPHEHKQQSDCFVFVGPGNFELHLWDRRAESPSRGKYMKLKVGADNPTMVIVPPGVVHGYKCVSEVSGWCLNLPNRLYKGLGKQEAEVDEIRWEARADSPYQIE